MQHRPLNSNDSSSRDSITATTSSNTSSSSSVSSSLDSILRELLEHHVLSPASITSSTSVPGVVASQQQQQEEKEDIIREEIGKLLDVVGEVDIKRKKKEKVEEAGEVEEDHILILQREIKELEGRLKTGKALLEKHTKILDQTSSTSTLLGDFDLTQES
jgi:hypothetical protein